MPEVQVADQLMAGKGIEPFVKKFQQGMLRVKYASVPVVSAVSGIALGGGCELLLHARSGSRTSKAISVWWKSAWVSCLRAAA